MHIAGGRIKGRKQRQPEVSGSAYVARQNLLKGELRGDEAKVAEPKRSYKRRKGERSSGSKQEKLLKEK